MSFRLELPEVCQWFAACTRPTALAVSHPILGPVAACERCAKRVHESDPERTIWRLTETDGQS